MSQSPKSMRLSADEAGRKGNSLVSVESSSGLLLRGDSEDANQKWGMFEYFTVISIAVLTILVVILFCFWGTSYQPNGATVSNISLTVPMTCIHCHHCIDI